MLTRKGSRPRSSIFVLFACLSVCLLISHPCSPERDGSTPLHVAARSGHARTLRLLLTLPSAHPDHPDAASHTPLHLACTVGRPAAAVVLLGAGADPNVADINGDTSLMWACYNDNHRYVIFFCDFFLCSTLAGFYCF
jgi:ankyrin repeat protein